MRAQEFKRIRRGKIGVSRHSFASQFDPASPHCYDFSAGWSSLVARWAHNPKVGGSNPPPATTYKHRQPKRTQYKMPTQLTVTFSGLPCGLKPCPRASLATLLLASRFEPIS